MTREQINISFNQAMNKAREVESSAKELNRMQKQMETTIVMLQSAWQGEGANTYLMKCRNMKQKMASTESDLYRIASVIRRTAWAFYEAEMKALEAVQKKTLI